MTYKWHVYSKVRSIKQMLSYNINKKTLVIDLRIIQRIFCPLLIIACLLLPRNVVFAEKNTTSEIDVKAKSFVLIEASTGKIICEKQKDKELMPASITKIMTLILIFEAIDEGKIKMEDMVTVSEHASSMGGSQVYLEVGETQTVKTMIKCISVSSANDACVAMAEHISGSEEAFVAKMNEKAAELGMEHSHFINCCGLDDGLTEGQHYSSAYDIALMSRELLTKHEEIKEFSTIWMDTITHVTRKGKSEFGLTNTNKLVRTYQGITGLKTGSTSKAKYCLSASAERNGLELIAVVMAAPEPNTRFVDAANLLDYGFANCTVYKDENSNLLKQKVKVEKGKKEFVSIAPAKSFSYLCTNGESVQEIDKKYEWKKTLLAPVHKGDVVGEIIYYYGEKEIGRVEIVSVQEIEKAGYLDYLKKCKDSFFVFE